MSNELICPLHGPYSAALGSCPRCAKGSSGRPQAPQPLDEEDEMPTDLGGGFSPRARRSSYIDDDESPTVLPGHHGGGRRILDIDEEETGLGRYQDDDVTELEFEVTGPQAIFWVKEGPRRGKIYKITDDMVVGRKSADLIIDNPKVSSTHAKIVYENDHYVIVDFRSKNGTYVNGERIRAETIIKENDLIRIGEVTFVLKVLD